MPHPLLHSRSVTNMHVSLSLGTATSHLEDAKHRHRRTQDLVRR